MGILLLSNGQNWGEKQQDTLNTWRLDWLQSLKQFFINVSYHILVAGLTLIAIRVRLATSIWYDTLMKNCFKDWSQSTWRSVYETTNAFNNCTEDGLQTELTTHEGLRPDISMYTAEVEIKKLAVAGTKHKHCIKIWRRKSNIMGLELDLLSSTNDMYIYHILILVLPLILDFWPSRINQFK